MELFLSITGDVERKTVFVPSLIILAMVPSIYWHTTIKGKSYAKSLGPQLRKYMEETANYWNFLKLCEELVGLSEKICELRPVAEIEDKNEKKITEVLQEEI